MCLQPAVDVPGQDVLQALALRQQLAAAQGGDGAGVRQVQLEVDRLALLEGLLGVLRDEVPDPRVRDMDGPVEVGWGLPLDGPQEGVDVRGLRLTVQVS